MKTLSTVVSGLFLLFAAASAQAAVRGASSLREDPVDQILYLRHVLRRIGLDDLVLFLVAIRELGLFATRDVLHQARFGAFLAFVFFGNLLVRRSVLFLL